MAYIIDGYNVIFAEPALAEFMQFRPEVARKKLLDRLHNFHVHKSKKLTVVFDGKIGITDGEKSFAGVRIIFSKRGTADEQILRMVRSSSNIRDLTVVTSDYKDIGKYVEAMGAKLFTAADFLKLLEEMEHKHKGGSEKPEKISDDEVDYWLRRFEDEG